MASQLLKDDPVSLAFNLVEPDEGSTDKPPVIFLHSVTTSKEYWYDIPKTVANATKRKVYAVDSRNHGDSPWNDVLNYDCAVSDLLHFMDDIKAPKAVLVGHSMGGTTSIKTALKAPERVEKLVVEDASFNKYNPKIIELICNMIGLTRNALEVMPIGLDEKSARLFVVDFILNAVPREIKPFVLFDENGYMVPLRKEENGRYRLKANIEAVEKAVQNSKSSQLKETGLYRGPACFIYGKWSSFQIFKDEEIIKKYFPNAELLGIEKASHNVHIDCPSEFKKALLDFLLEE